MFPFNFYISLLQRQVYQKSFPGSYFSQQTCRLPQHKKGEIPLSLQPCIGFHWQCLWSLQDLPGSLLGWLIVRVGRSGWGCISTRPNFWRIKLKISINCFWASLNFWCDVFLSNVIILIHKVGKQRRNTCISTGSFMSELNRAVWRLFYG